MRTITATHCPVTPSAAVTPVLGGLSLFFIGDGTTHRKKVRTTHHSWRRNQLVRSRIKAEGGSCFVGIMYVQPGEGKKR